MLMPFKDQLEENIRLENEGRDRDRQLQEAAGDFLLDLRTMLDVLNSTLRIDLEIESSDLGRTMNSTIATLRASLNELLSQERLE
jgi:hypothetical protein